MIRSYIAPIVLGLAVTMASTVPAVAQVQREGLQVRGHWILTVRNPDGAVAQRAEFDNHLTSWGAYTLAQVLEGTVSFNWWYLSLRSTPRVQDQEVFGLENGGSAIIYPADREIPSWFGATTFNTLRSGLLHDQLLTYFPSTPGQPVNALELAGAVSAANEGVLTHVSAIPMACRRMGSCIGDLPFTHTDIPDSTPAAYVDGTPMPNGLRVQPGQTIDVTVQISFTYQPIVVLGDPR